MPSSSFIGLTVFDDLQKGPVGQQQQVLSAHFSTTTTTKTQFHRLNPSLATEFKPFVTDNEVIQPRSLSDLLTLNPVPRFTPQPERGARGTYDDVWDPRWDSMNRHSLRNPETDAVLSATPIGGYLPMNRMAGTQFPHQGSPSGLGEERPMDLITFKFKPGTTSNFKWELVYWELDTQSSGLPTDCEEDELECEDDEVDGGENPPLGFVPAPEAFEWSRMRTELISLKGCYMLIYGICEDVSDAVTLLICKYGSSLSALSNVSGYAIRLPLILIDLNLGWRNTVERTETFNGNKQRKIFAGLDPWLECQPVIRHIPSMNIERCSMYNMDVQHQRVELVEFFVRSFPHSRSVFEYYFKRFTAFVVSIATLSFGTD